MREILFKAKRINNGKWVEGYLFETREHTYIAYANQFDDDLFYATSNIFILVDPNTLCRYTGLNDKNGNKIWENDVVKHYNSKYEPNAFVMGTICWSQNTSTFLRTSRHSHLHWHISSDCRYEVIGNIFDNPELLKEGD